MPPPKPVSPMEVTVLMYLRDQAVDGRGWLRRGVRGWRLYGEVRAATGEYISERLPHLARRGLLDRLDVPDFGRQRPTLLFRISEAGARRLEEMEGRPGRPFPPPGAQDVDGGNLYVPASAWSALETLRRYAADRLGSVRLDAHGWLTAAEIRHAQHMLCGEDVAWLLRRGLVVLHEAAGSGPSRKPIRLYRISEWGMRTEPVDAVAAPSGRVEFVEARVREEAGPRRGRKRHQKTARGPRRAPEAAGKH